MKPVVVGRYGVLYKQPTSEAELPAAPVVVDMRSDTVTKPTDEMRVAMFEADVGDDVFCDDPTVNKLEKAVASTFGKEAALFVSSGTQGNLISVLAHCPNRGDEVLVGEKSHISIYEQGGVAQFGGVHPRTVRNLPDGTLDLEDIKSKLLPEDVHFTRVRLVCAENTHGLLGGKVIGPEFMAKLSETIRGTGIKLHLDGARIFNAATALGLPVIKLVEHADSVSTCLSKALGAPIGSVIAGTAEFIASARRLRKALGGGMRQVGVIAAPGLIAFEKMSKNLQTDHDNAKRLGSGLVEMSDLGIEIELSSIETNIVLFQLNRDDISAKTFVELLARAGDGEDAIVKLLALNSVTIRATTHYQVTEEGIDLALEKMRQILSEK